MTIDVIFLDSGREPQCKPDPKFPDGKPINLATSPLAKTCTSNVPFPAPRCGLYAIRCLECGFTAMVTVAGRPDDPNTVTMPCQPKRTSSVPKPTTDLFGSA
jgi:hypothetical protein